MSQTDRNSVASLQEDIRFLEKIIQALQGDLDSRDPEKIKSALKYAEDWKDELEAEVWSKGK